MPTSLSVVVETVTGARPELDRCLAALAAGTVAPAEVLVVVDPAGAGRPLPAGVRRVVCDDARYYPMKNAGARAASGRAVAFVDADCVPCPDWVERAQALLDAGADVAVGRSSYGVPGVAGRIIDAHAWGHQRVGEDGRAQGLAAHNVAFRAELLAREPWDERPARSGSCYLLARRLLAAGADLRLDPRMHVTHTWSAKDFVGNRLRSGHDAIVLPESDEDGVLVESRFARLGPLRPFAVAAHRLRWDAGRLATRPGLLATAPAFRALEAAGGVVALASRDAIPRWFPD